MKKKYIDKEVWDLKGISCLMCFMVCCLTPVLNVLALIFWIYLVEKTRTSKKQNMEKRFFWGFKKIIRYEVKK